MNDRDSGINTSDYIENAAHHIEKAEESLEGLAENVELIIADSICFSHLIDPHTRSVTVQVDVPQTKRQLNSNLPDGLTIVEDQTSLKVTTEKNIQNQSELSDENTLVIDLTDGGSI